MRFLSTLCSGFAMMMLASANWASCNLSAARIGSTLVKVGDSERRVIEAGPNREVQLEHRGGGAAGLRFDFYQRGTTIQIFVRGGQVTRICHVRD
jgi:hypothetical protein